MSEIATLTTILSKLASLARYELELQNNVRGDVERVTRELEHIRAFLRMSNGAATENDLQHHAWVSQVRSVALMSEDILDEYTFHFGLDQQCISGCCVNFRAQHDIASRIQNIVQMFQEVSQRNARYQDYNHGILRQASHSAQIRRPYNGQEDAHFLREADIVAIDNPKRKLIDMLLAGDSTLKVVAAVGMGGSGKTTLVKRVFDDVEVKRAFRLRAWITVAQNYAIENLLKDLLYKLETERRNPVEEEEDRRKIYELKKNFEKSLQGTTSFELKVKIHELLRDATYVIVIDDLWSIDAWNDIKHAFPPHTNSRLVITTRKTDVALCACQSREHIYNMEKLPNGESWKLFCQKVFGHDGICPEHLVAVSKSILQKCDGLPLAIAAISGVLANSMDEAHQSDEWARIDRSIGVESVQKILSLSYDDLPDHLRPCYLYLSIFPADYPIHQNELVRLWIAEGFIQEADDGRTLERVAEEYIKELVNRSMIQVTEVTADGRVKTCRIHDQLRKMIISKSKDQDFILVANQTSGAWPEQVRRLSVLNNLQNIRKNQTFHQLRSLLMFGMAEDLTKASLPALFSGGFRLLTVLNLQGTKLEKFPKNIAKLFNLRYLGLRRTEVRNVPSSIGSLTKLQTLDLKQTHVTMLPTEIQKLQQLRHILVYNYYGGHGFKAPRGIGALQSLQGLCDVDAEQGSYGVLRELGMLTQLLRLGIDRVSETNQEVIWSSIQKMSHLRSLMLKSSTGKIMNLHNLHTPPLSLQRLSLVGQLESLPHRILQSLQNLVHIDLIRSQLQNDPLETLQQLPNLVHIRLDNAYQGNQLSFKAGRFQKLKTLHLYSFDTLEEVLIENNTMPNLNDLSIRRCALLRRVPLGIEGLRKLQKLHFFGMPQELRAAIQPTEGMDHSKVAHIPLVTVVSEVDGIWWTEILSSN